MYETERATLHYNVGTQICKDLESVDPLRYVTSCLQAIEGAYTLQSKLLSVVDRVSGISTNVTKRLQNTESLASYDTIHPLYIQVTISKRAHICHACIIRNAISKHVSNSS